jgi:hypothetical protein
VEPGHRRRVTVDEMVTAGEDVKARGVGVG